MLKILMRADRIPLNSIVSKRTWQKEYMLRDRIRLFSAGHTQQELKAVDGARLLVSDTGDANAVSGDVELIWYADECAVQDLLDELDGGCQ